MRCCVIDSCAGLRMRRYNDAHWLNPHTFKEAEEKALAAEIALLNARLLRQQQQHESLPQDDVYYAAHTHASAHKVAATSEYQKHNKPCYSCGSQHSPQPVSFPLLYAIIAKKEDTLLGCV